MTANGTAGRFAIEEWPDPVCRYSHDDDTPVVNTVNRAFETVLGSIEAGEPVTAIFEVFDLSIVLGPEDPAAVGTEADQIIVEAGTGDSEARADDQYLLRVVPPEEDGVGVLLFNPHPTELAWKAGEIGLDHVASVISHDLRNPLDVAKAHLRAARETGEADHFEHVADAHERMERIVEDVLTLARGSDVIQPDKVVELSGVVENAWANVDTDDADIVVKGSLPSLIADSNRLGRLFENLFRNSIQHGGTAVSVTVGSLESAKGFYVADDGRGIPSEQRDLVFDPGFSTDDHGTGLGLSIVARIADLHGWLITVTESANGGARFEVTGIETS